MNKQKLYHSLYKKRKMHASKQQIHSSKPQQQSQFRLPAVVNPATRLSTKENVWRSIGIFLAILFIISATISIRAVAQHTTASQSARKTLSSPTTSTPTQQTTILNPPPISMGKRPLTPTPVPPAMPTPTTLNAVPTACPGVNCNPWGYNFTPGNLIYNPPTGFCNYFACVPNFYKPLHPPNGYIVECNDGMYTPSGGGPRTCGLHGGVLLPLYAH